MENRSSRSNSGSITERIPLKTALIFGLVSFVVIFIAIFGLLLADAMLQEEIEDDTVETDDEPGFITQGGWAFFDSHFVGVEASATTGFGGIEESISVLDEWVEELPTTLFNLIPVGILIITGYIFVSRMIEQIQSETDAALFGASIVVGYLPAAIFGVLLWDFQTEIDGTRVTYEIPFTEGILIAGILFPVIFGAIGGFIAHSRKS